MIYLRIDGRIGNQLFMYAFAKSVSKEVGDENIIIDDTEVIKKNYRNCLLDYNLENVSFVHSHSMLYKKPFRKINIIFLFYRIFRKRMNFNKRYNMEKKWQLFFNKNGLILCENGYLPHNIKGKKVIFINGYFQSDRYFSNISKYIKEKFSLKDNLLEHYPGINEILIRNSVCISIKVQHNVGNPMYDICNDGYWQRSIDYMKNNVDNPLFFVCSDNTEYVKNNLIDCNKYDVLFQDPDLPVSISLAVMSRCKHFVIGNTTFGWWAQYLSSNPDKIVIAPNRWMNIEMPIDIYQAGWHLMEV